MGTFLEPLALWLLGQGVLQLALLDGALRFARSSTTHTVTTLAEDEALCDKLIADLVAVTLALASSTLERRERDRLEQQANALRVQIEIVSARIREKRKALIAQSVENDRWTAQWQNVQVLAAVVAAVAAAATFFVTVMELGK